MQFELLANELLFDVFEYLSFVDLLNGFQNLNNRFDNLIVDYCQTCQALDFRLISKENLNLFRRRYLPSVVDHIETIYLSDNDRNPYEIDLFLSRLYPIYRFTNLRSISLESLYSIDKLKRLLNDLKQIPTLNSLKLIESYLENDPKKLVEIMNQIWSLENLQDCYLDFSFSSKSYFIVSTIFSCSIENLTIKGFQCSFEELAFLYEHTPNLKSLSIELTSSFDDDQSKLLLIPTLTQLNLKTSVSADFIVSLLKKTPCLNQLSVQTKNVYIDGNKWQSIIENYLFYLQKFDFQMEFSSETDEHQEEFDRIVKSFENSFWIEQRQWFIRCFSFKQNDLNFYNVHSLPFHFKHFNINFNENFSCKSTVPTDEQSSFQYNYVQNLDCSSSIVDNLHLPKFQFENVQNLTLTIGSEMNLFEFVKCRYENLRSISIRLIDYLHHHEQIQQIQSIFDQSPNLFHVAFTFWQRNFSKTKKRSSSNENEMAPFNLRSSSIRSLDLRGVDDGGHKHCYTEQQCSAFIRSPLAMQCQHLTINVDKRTSILDLIDKMKHLKTLNVSCRDKIQNKEQIIKWLHSHSSTTMIHLAKESKHSDDLRLAIR